ncbi:MAG: FAD-binding dehydrogenase [Deltaproteobacteria bacterium]|nr:FAD-binding dehydrogenase [Deltaproteobacteria bacterium]
MPKQVYRADVLVIGGGLAGIATALELVDRGVSVVLLERGPEERFGGLAKLSFGGLFFVDSPEQRRSGIKDSYELALHDWLRFGELSDADVWPRRWAESYIERSVPDVRDWLYRRGVRFLPAVNWTERGYFVPGNSVPRFHITWGTGRGIVDPLVAALRSGTTAAELVLRFEHRVDELVTKDGAVIGCAGHTAGGEDFEAYAGATVLAAGGIAGNLGKIREHWAKSLGPPPEELLNGSHLEADGAMLDEAVRNGARVTHLENMWNYAAGVRHWRPRFENDGLSLVPGKSALWLDPGGRRFCDPPLVGSFDTLHLVERICREPKKYSWQVLNMRIARRELAISGGEFNPELREHKLGAFLLRMLFGDRKLPQELIANCPDVVTATSVAELAAKMNKLIGNHDVDAERLAAEIADYDANIDRGAALQNDDQLRRIAQVRKYKGDRLRTCKNQKILEPGAMPLIAMRLRIVTRKSLGGVVVDTEGRVLDEHDRPLSGLYAAGEICGFGGGGIHGRRALEGTFLGGCIFTGRRVAESIARGRTSAGRVA